MNRASEILSRISPNEKPELCMGQNDWYANDSREHGIPAIRMSDGTNGIRIDCSEDEKEGPLGIKPKPTNADVKVLSQDSAKLHQLQPATFYPFGFAIASSWNRDTVSEIATLVANECYSRDASLLLVLEVNIRCWRFASDMDACNLAGNPFIGVFWGYGQMNGSTTKNNYSAVKTVSELQKSSDLD